MRAILKYNLPRLIIISPFYNCSELVRLYVHNLKLQSYPNWICYCIDDNSNDNTYNILKDLTYNDNRFIILRNKINKGSLYNRDYIIRNEDIYDDDICIIMDGDDTWGTKYALEILVKEYLYWDIMCTTARNHCLRDGLEDDGAIFYDRQQLLDADHHMFSLYSFKAKLWRNIPKDYMIDPRTDEYYMSDSDTCYTFPILWQAGPQHHHHIFKDNYIIYNNIRPICDDYKVGDEGHKEATKLILNNFHKLIKSDGLPMY